jgi:hypothetical protein
MRGGCGCGEGRGREREWNGFGSIWSGLGFASGQAITELQN